MMAKAVSIKIATSKIRIDIPDPAYARQEEANADEPEEESESEEHRGDCFIKRLCWRLGFINMFLIEQGPKTPVICCI